MLGVESNSQEIKSGGDQKFIKKVDKFIFISGITEKNPGINDLGSDMVNDI
jgi:hypothetical protein